MGSPGAARRKRRDSATTQPSTVSTTGMGLTGAKRLVNDFELDSKVGGGTRVTIVRWK